MRIVRGQHYENLTDDLTEVTLIRKRVPGIKRYYEQLHRERDRSREKREMSPLYNTPAFNLVASAHRRKHRGGPEATEATGTPALSAAGLGERRLGELEVKLMRIEEETVRSNPRRGASDRNVLAAAKGHLAPGASLQSKGSQPGLNADLVKGFTFHDSNNSVLSKSLESRKNSPPAASSREPDYAVLAKSNKAGEDSKGSMRKHQTRARFLNRTQLQTMHPNSDYVSINHHRE
jgi:hypothetical protein